MTFTVPSPSSSDDHWDGPKVSLEGDWEKSCFEQSPNRKLFFKPSSMWATTRTNHELSETKVDHFAGKKNKIPHPTNDILVLRENDKLKNRTVNSLVVPTPAVRDNLVAKDRNNRFKGLKIETSAPKEDIELVDPGTARSVAAKPYSKFPSFNRAEKGTEAFPALPSSKMEPTKGVAPLSTSKSKVFNIGITAVKLHEAKSKCDSRKRFSKGPLFGVRPIESDGVDGSADSAWTTVVKGKRC